jgi:hypothetical protein
MKARVSLRRTKTLLLIVLMLSSFHANSALATCRMSEYAELKNTPSDDLVKMYCRYKAVPDLEAEHLRRLRELSSTPPQRVPQESLEGSISEHTKSAKQCLEMQDKIRSALRNCGNRTSSAVTTTALWRKAHPKVDLPHGFCYRLGS